MNAAKKSGAPKAKKEFQIIKKRSGRFSVKSKSGKFINGIEKVKILLDKKLIKTGLPKAAPEAPADAPAAT